MVIFGLLIANAIFEITRINVVDDIVYFLFYRNCLLKEHKKNDLRSQR